jgi:phage-related protein
MRILFYKSNKAPVQEFISRLEVKDRARILACLKSIEDLGMDSPRVQFRQIRGKLWEIKIKGVGATFRIFYVLLRKESMILLHAYKKQSQKAPTKEIQKAEKRMLEVLSNESNHLN